MKFSDSGTNIVGAAREVKEIDDHWNQTLFQDADAQQILFRKFNPRCALQFGGIWERLF